MMPTITPHLWYSREARRGGERVSDAMLKQVKFDIAELKRAAAGEARV